MHDRHVGDGQAFDLGDRADVLGDRRGDVEDVRGVGADGDLVHVEHRRRVEHRAAVGHREHRDGVGHALAHQRGAVDRVDGEVAVRAVAVADLFAVVEHRRVVLLALADHHDAAHRHRVHQLAHGVDGRAVAALLVAAADPATRGHRAGLGDPDELEGEVAVRGFTTRTCSHGCRLSQKRVAARELGYWCCDDAARADRPSRPSPGCCRTAGTCSGRSRRWWWPASSWPAWSECARFPRAASIGAGTVLRRGERAAGRRADAGLPGPVAAAARGLAGQLRRPRRYPGRPDRPVDPSAAARRASPPSATSAPAGCM